MEKPTDEGFPRDRDGEIFQDDLTENESEPSPAKLEEEAHGEKLDPGVDSEEGDRAMEENRFGVNTPKKP